MNTYPSEARLLTAVEAIYDAAPNPSKWPSALQAIADCFGDVGALLLWRRDDGSYGSMVSESLVEAQRDYEDGGWTNRDILAIRGMERGYFFSGDPFTTRNLVSENGKRCFTRTLTKRDRPFLTCNFYGRIAPNSGHCRHGPCLRWARAMIACYQDCCVGITNTSAISMCRGDRSANSTVSAISSAFRNSICVFRSSIC